MIKIYLKFVLGIKDIRFKFIPYYKEFIQIKGGVKNGYN